MRRWQGRVGLASRVPLRAVSTAHDQKYRGAAGPGDPDNTAEIPQIQYIEKVVDVPVQRTVEVPQVQYVDKFVDVLVQRTVEVPPVLTVQKFPEVPPFGIGEREAEI